MLGPPMSIPTEQVMLCFSLWIQLPPGVADGGSSDGGGEHHAVGKQRAGWGRSRDSWNVSGFRGRISVKTDWGSGVGSSNVKLEPRASQGNCTVSCHVSELPSQ